MSISPRKYRDHDLESYYILYIFSYHRNLVRAFQPRKYQSEKSEIARPRKRDYRGKMGIYSNLLTRLIIVPPIVIKKNKNKLNKHNTELQWKPNPVMGTSYESLFNVNRKHGKLKGKCVRNVGKWHSIIINHLWAHQMKEYFFHFHWCGTNCIWTSNRFLRRVNSFLLYFKKLYSTKKVLVCFFICIFQLFRFIFDIHMGYSLKDT